MQSDALSRSGSRAEVGSERRLTIGSRWYELESAPCLEDTGAEPTSEVTPLVFVRDRRHRDEDVVGQQRHYRVYVGLGAPDGPAARAALTESIRAAKA